MFRIYHGIVSLSTMIDLSSRTACASLVRVSLFKETLFPLRSVSGSPLNETMSATTTPRVGIFSFSGGVWKYLRKDICVNQTSRSF